MSFDIKAELYDAVKDIEWNFVGILDTKKRLHEIPKNLNFQALFEKLVLERLEKLNKEHKIEVTFNDNIRTYPDIILRGGKLDKKIIALDIKTGRRHNNKTNFTLGSYAGYFRNPDEKRCAGKLSYNDFNEHWCICFIYDWDQTKDTLHMISNIQIVVQEKWRIASRTTGTGTTTAIGSIRNIDRIKSGQGDFKTEKEFLIFWRKY
jgi:hypothetical protein